HGSLAREQRLDAEQRLKSGALKALVATASLELGIDIGEVDLVCQLGSPRAIATFLQRVGRSGHAVDGTPKGRLFPLSRDELVECSALIDSVRRGELDRLTIPEQPLDVLAQQIVAEVAARDCGEDELYALFRRAFPYRNIRVERGTVRVADAKGMAPTIPFWLGEAPGRSDELSQAVSRLRSEIATLLEDDSSGERALHWLIETVGVGEPAARQLVD